MSGLPTPRDPHWSVWVTHVTLDIGAELSENEKVLKKLPQRNSKYRRRGKQVYIWVSTFPGYVKSRLFSFF